MAYKPDDMRILWEGKILPKCHSMGGRTGNGRGEGRFGREEKSSVPIPAAKNSLRNKQLPTAAQSITLVGSSRHGGKGKGGGSAVGAAFINPTAGAEPRLAPLNRKPPGVF